MLVHSESVEVLMQGPPAPPQAAFSRSMSKVLPTDRLLPALVTPRQRGYLQLSAYGPIGSSTVQFTRGAEDEQRGARKNQAADGKDDQDEAFV